MIILNYFQKNDDIKIIFKKMIILNHFLEIMLKLFKENDYRIVLRKWWLNHSKGMIIELFSKNDNWNHFFWEWCCWIISFKNDIIKLFLLGMMLLKHS